MAGVAFSVVVFVVALVGVSWGVWHREEGFRLLRACWTTLEDGTQVPRYVEGTEVSVYGPCEGAQELVWPQERIPLAVAAVSDLETFESDSRLIQTAVDDVNRQVKFELFQFIGDGLGADACVLVYHGEEVETEEDLGPQEGNWDPHFPGYAIHYRDGYESRDRRLYSDIVLGVFGNGNDNRNRVLWVEHFLLHSVGLAHDSDPSSLMFPPSQRGGVLSGQITEGDQMLLRRLYGGPRKPRGME